MRITEMTDKKEWEAFIAKYAPQSIFQSWSWGETIIHSIPKHAGQNSKLVWRLGIYDDGSLEGIVQVQLVKAKRGRFLHLRHGPLLRVWKKTVFVFLINYLRTLAKDQKAVFIRISPLIENSPQNISFFRSFGFIDAPIHQMDGEYCWVLDIGGEEEQLLLGMRKTTRYLVRQAQKIGVEIVKSKKSNDLDSFLTLYAKTAQRHHFVQHQGIREEFNQFLSDDQLLLFQGFFNNKLLSAALILFYNNQAIYHHSASVEQKIPVNYLLQWEAIREAKRRAVKLYNFWGVAPEDNKRHPWRGLTLFKKGFGGKLIEYMHAKDLPLSPLYCATYTVETVRKVLKGY